MGKTKVDGVFSKLHWRNFEILTGLLFEIDFKLDKREIVITKMSKDGGKDVKISKAFYQKILEFPKIEIWVEAKLRGRVNRVNIGDIAGSVIMASNSNIRSVYFVTNCFFTKQSIEELLLFAYKSGLKINLVNGCNYRNLLEEHFDEVLIRSQTNAHIESANDFRLFMLELLETLPDYPDLHQDEIELTIGKGKVLPSTKFEGVIKQEKKIEHRKLSTLKSQPGDKVLRLNEAKLSPLVTDKEVQDNIGYQLIGDDRKRLLKEITSALYNGETAILKGDSGQGKSFFANHILRDAYRYNYSVLFIDAVDNNLISFSKEVISYLIGLDYFKFWNDDGAIIAYLSEYFQLDLEIGTKILEIMRKDKFTETVAPEVCLEISVKLFENHNNRKKSLLIVDNIHKASNDLMAFLKTLFLRLRKNGTAVLALSIHQSNENQLYVENQWLQFLDSIAESNNFKTFVLPRLSEHDLAVFIETLIPGANKNLINFVAKNTLKDPFFVELYVGFLKQQGAIKSADGKYWWLDDTAALIDASHLKSNQINHLIIAFLKARIADKLYHKIATTLFLFNNSIRQEDLEMLLGEIDPAHLIKSGLFHVIYKDNGIHFSFVHDLFYQNYSALVSSQDLLLASARLLHKYQDKDRPDVLGKLSEFAGDFNSAYREYLKFSSSQLQIAPFSSLLYYEKALDVAVGQNIVDPPLSVIELIYKTFHLYEKYNFLSSRKAPNLFATLAKHVAFKQLTTLQTVMYLYYSGVKYTKDENFQSAKGYFQKAYDDLIELEDLPAEWIDKIITCFGINLKHVGEKERSLEFFDAALQKWGSKQIKWERYSNAAAFYLTTKPSTSLEYYKKMETELMENEDVHLLIDFAMANFYLKNDLIAESYLQRALPLSKKTINLAEEARAENIFGIISWKRGELDRAESLLDAALSNGELANNHRWIWRIKANLAQVAFDNNKLNKAYNLCWSIINHLLKEKETLMFEAENENISSRRYAAVKATAYLFYKMEKLPDLKKMESLVDFDRFSVFSKNIQKVGDLSFDSQDTNRYENVYHILG